MWVPKKFGSKLIMEPQLLIMEPGHGKKIGSRKKIWVLKFFWIPKKIGVPEKCGSPKIWVKINHGTAAAYNGTAAAYVGTAAAYVGTAAAYGLTILIIMPLLRPNPLGFFPQGRVWQLNLGSASM